MKDSVRESTIKDTGFGYALRIMGGNFRLPILYTLISRSLTMTLREMEEDGLVIRNEISHFPLCVEYSLTDYAKTLCRILDEMTEWGDRNRKEVDREEE